MLPTAVLDCPFDAILADSQATDFLQNGKTVVDRYIVLLTLVLSVRFPFVSVLSFGRVERS